MPMHLSAVRFLLVFGKIFYLVLFIYFRYKLCARRQFHRAGVVKGAGGRGQAGKTRLTAGVGLRSQGYLAELFGGVRGGREGMECMVWEKKIVIYIKMVEKIAL